VARADPVDLIEIIRARDQALRNRSLDDAVDGADLDRLLSACTVLERFRKESDNLYERVRALLFLHALYRYHVPAQLAETGRARIPEAGYEQLLDRRFEAAIDRFLVAQRQVGPSDALSSALAAAYRAAAFQTLADQVRASVRAVPDNVWMFGLSDVAAHPLTVRAELGRADRPALRESTPVRMDLSHSGWSDIFFLAMDDPEGARVLNVSIDLAVRGRDAAPRPPIECELRVIDEPLLRLRSVDLGETAELHRIVEVFDFARDHLGLLKAGVVAAGIVPLGLEDHGGSLEPLLARIVGPGRGLEIVSQVRGIPRGSRLAVSTNLLASLIALCMRATGQTASLTGALDEKTRCLVAARAILGEWLAGSGGGWQDSGGLWPSIKLIEGVVASPGDPELGVSRGRLLPRHRLLGGTEISAESLAALESSLVLTHGGMAQDVGPILEMVTERYLLRSGPEWQARLRAREVFDEIGTALAAGDVRRLGAATTDNFFGPIRSILPWASNLYTEEIVARVRAARGDDFWGFWMLGGMAGGGMGFLFDPERRDEALTDLAAVMATVHDELRDAVPFAIEPVIYDFAINERGTWAELVRDDREREPPAAEDLAKATNGGSLDGMLAAHGFDREHHEQLRADLRAGRVGLARNRLPSQTAIDDVADEHVIDAASVTERHREQGRAALAAGSVAVVSLAAGTGSRWTDGAGVVKALAPFARLGGAHRRFLDVHVAKSRRTARRFGLAPMHVVTTGFLTHDAIAAYVASRPSALADVPLVLSAGRIVGLRLVPTVRDLRFAWIETLQQVEDERAQKLKESLQTALIDWATTTGEASDYRDNLALQCMHPPGHFYEVPNLLLNGTLARLLAERPQLRTLLVHNIDTVGVDLDPGLLGLHLDADSTLTFEVIPRRVEDEGGGLTRLAGRPCIVEGMALPRELDALRLGYYSSMTTWVDIDRYLGLMSLERGDLGDAERVVAGVRALADRVPLYVTLKSVKKRWGDGQEDVFPVAQFERLWSDLTRLEEVEAAYVVVPRRRGQQLKQPAQLDGWMRDGSAAWVEANADW